MISFHVLRIDPGGCVSAIRSAVKGANKIVARTAPQSPLRLRAAGYAALPQVG